MENMKEELYNELHIVKKYDKEIINRLISNYSNWIMNNYHELKSIVKTAYKLNKLNTAIELFNKYKNTIFINGMLIFNYYDDPCKRELEYDFINSIIYCWANDMLVFSIKFESVRTIETKHEILYREDETLLW